MMAGVCLEDQVFGRSGRVYLVDDEPFAAWKFDKHGIFSIDALVDVFRLGVLMDILLARHFAYLFGAKFLLNVQFLLFPLDFPLCLFFRFQMLGPKLGEGGRVNLGRRLQRVEIELLELAFFECVSERRIGEALHR